MNKAIYLANTLILAIVIMCQTSEVISTMQRRRQHFLQQPSNVTVSLGHTVQLPCQVADLVGQLQWTRDQFGLGVGRHLPAWPRYSLVGDVTLGHGALRIDSVQLDDQGVYQCQAGAAEGHAGIRSRDAWLTVLVPPDRVNLRPSGDVTALAGHVTRFECTCHGANPLPQIEWSLTLVNDTTTVIRTNITTRQHTLSDGHTPVVQSILYLFIQRRYHKSSIMCSIGGAAVLAPKRSVSARLMVSYAPIVSVEPSHPRVVEYDNVSLWCEAETHPGANLTYSWTINEQPVAESWRQQLQLLSVGRELHQANISCHVTSSVGTGIQRVQLQVLYLPRFVAEPVDVSADGGQRATLSCQVSANPAAQISWYKLERNQHRKMVGVGENVTVRVGLDTVGVYECRVTAAPAFISPSSGQTIARQLRLRMRSPPLVTSSSPVYASVGDRVDLQCSVFSVPTPTATNWYMYSRSLHNDAEHFTMVNMEVNGGVTSRLVIESVLPQHFGVYNCTFWNSRGIGSDIVLLRQTSSSVLVLSVCGACGVLLLATGAALWVMFGRRRHRTQPVQASTHHAREGVEAVKKTCPAHAYAQAVAVDTYSCVSDRSSSVASSGLATIIPNNLLASSRQLRNSSYFETAVQRDAADLTQARHTAHSGMLPNSNEQLALLEQGFSAMYADPGARAELTLSRLPPPPSYRSSTQLATHV